MRTLCSRLCWAPAALWYGLIWSLSAQPAEQSANVSVSMLQDVLTAGGSDYTGAEAAVRTAVNYLLNMYIRKAAHMFLFFVLALLIWLALSRLLKSRPRRAAVTALLCTLLAALDEYHQTLVPGRSGEARDVLVDLCGILIALFLFALPWLAGRLQRGMKHPERLWLSGAAVGVVLLVWVGTQEGIAPIFSHRATQLYFFMWMDEASRSALLADCAPILRQALYLAACAVAGFVTVIPAVLSGDRRSVRVSLTASALLCGLAALIWDLPLLPGALLALAAGAAALVLQKAFPLLQR